ncbi:MAG: hypothetical protein A2W03_09820 [Candidatus Aminicenantes bacterium RBG_16_63_16]|nr:MAG: hypothetical protein A2W03_09820 [Candidatus Aminicenantes bacterium RBG_16_63_16]
MIHQPSRVCPDDKVFVKAFLSELNLEKQDALIAHVLTCSRCRLKFQTMRKVKSELKRIREPGKRTRFRLSISLKFAGVAAVIILVVLTGLFIQSKLDNGGILRGWNKEKISLIEPVGNIQELPSIFKWTPIKNADTYAFRLIDDELNTIIALDVYKTAIELPARTRNILVRGKTYVWIVDAFNDEYLKLDSARGSFEIR